MVILCLFIAKKQRISIQDTLGGILFGVGLVVIFGYGLIGIGAGFAGIEYHLGTIAAFIFLFLLAFMGFALPFSVGAL